MLNKEPTVSAAYAASARTELAQRSSNGIDVYLLWSPGDDSLAVAVFDDAGDSFELVVEPHEALEVFHHPYAYAAFRGALELVDVAA
jgi:hypothetical protein